MEQMKTMPAHDPVAIALAEDVGTGDATVRFFTDPQTLATARIVSREECCLAGLEAAQAAFRKVDSALRLHAHHRDGAVLVPDECVLEIAGSLGSILTAERTALNFLQRLSGIATLTRAYVRAIEGTPARILDTRKTTPGLRHFEKAAVAAGGGTNHRFGLDDMIMVKDNHLAAGLNLAQLQTAIDAAKADAPRRRIELEADTLEQALGFFTLRGVDVVLLDNMALADMREAVQRKPPQLQLEASGGITLETIRAVAETGVDFISVGALTHSARAIDFSLEMNPAP